RIVLARDDLIPHALATKIHDRDGDGRHRKGLRMECGLGANHQHEELKARHRLLKNELGALLADRDMLVTTVRKGIEREYQLLFGELELQHLTLDVEVRRLRRYLTICQAAQNLG